MKLLIFCPYYPPHVGGLESHAAEFNEHMSAQGFDITVFTPRLPLDALEDEIKFKQVKVIRFPAFEIINNYPLPKFWSLKFWKQFFALFKQDFDIVISRTRFFSTSLLALCYAKLKRKPWVHIEHGSDFVTLSSKLKSLIAKLYDYTFGYLIFKTSSLNISISKAVQSFVHRFNPSYSPVIYRGLDTNKIDSIPPDRTIKEKYKDKIIIVTAGRLYKWKGMINSIYAVNSLPKEIKDKIVFLLIGNGEDYEDLKKAAIPPIYMLGNLPREQVMGIMKTADIYIHSSYPGGGLSTSLLEAMYCQCAIVATPYEGANEIVQDNKNGLLLLKSDHKEINDKLQLLIKDAAKRNKLGKRAKQSIKEKFNWEKTTATYLSLLKSII